MVGYDFWQKKFGGDPGIVGKQALIDGQEATIIGVTPKGFQGTQFVLNLDGYIPLNMQPTPTVPTFWTDRSSRGLAVLARLKPGVTLQQAQSSLNVVMARLAEQNAATDKGVTIRVVPERLARPQPFPNNIVPFIAGIFLVLAGLVLLLACMNVANILLVRATMRQREMAIRAAMGANRWRLIRQMLTESIMLALFGGVGGLAVGVWASSAVGALIPAGRIPIRVDFGFDWRVFGYAMGAALFTGAIVGLWPALRAGRADVNSVLQSGGRSDTAGAGRHRLRSVLVVAQVAGSLVLLIVAGLFVRSLMRAQHAYLGFDADHVLNLTLDPREVGYDETRTKTFYHDLETKVRALPGVQSASLAFSVPMGPVQDGSMIYVEGQPQTPGQPAPIVIYNHVDEPYFDTMRIPLLRGRAFQESDNDKAPLVAVITQSMAQQFWPNQDRDREALQHEECHRPIRRSRRSCRRWKIRIHRLGQKTVLFCSARAGLRGVPDLAGSLVVAAGEHDRANAERSSRARSQHAGHRRRDHAAVALRRKWIFYLPGWRDFGSSHGPSGTQPRSCRRLWRGFVRREPAYA